MSSVTRVTLYLLSQKPVLGLVLMSRLLFQYSITYGQPEECPPGDARAISDIGQPMDPRHGAEGEETFGELHDE